MRTPLRWITIALLLTTTAGYAAISDYLEDPGENPGRTSGPAGD